MTTLLTLNEYAALGWKIFPLQQNGKRPLTKQGFKDATDNKFQIAKWFAAYKGCNWGMATGDIVVVDVDTKNGGQIDPDLPITRMSRTGNNGFHLFYTNPLKIDIRNSAGALATGVDVRGYGGYVVIPPSTLGDGKEYVWLNEELMAMPPKQLMDTVKEKSETLPMSGEPDPVEVTAAVAKLSKARAENYETWVKVGMALHNVGEDMLPLWDTWSKQAESYEPGKCAEKWLSFHADSGITVASLFAWAMEDSAGTYVRPATKDPKPSEYMSTLHQLGYTFSMNAMNDRVYANGHLLADGLSKHMMTLLRESNFKNDSVFGDAVVSEAYEHQFHPILDYLNSLTWNGKDHIAELCTYFKDRDDIFPMLMRKWLVGAAAKIILPLKENPMLVLDGKQGKGKSYFVRWLGSVLPEFFKTSPIEADNKDFVIDTVSYFVWEVEELGSTFRKSDREALKAFIMRLVADYRSPYGKYPVKKNVTCSYIGTLNDEGGFLTDPTGNRRFRVCTLTNIDWSYTKLNVNDIWAQAVALAEAGETSVFTAEENTASEAINERYEVDDPLAYYIEKYFAIDPADKTMYTPTAEIATILSTKGLQVNATDQRINNRIGAVLTRFGLSKAQKRGADGKQSRGWYGIAPKDKPFESIM